MEITTASDGQREMTMVWAVVSVCLGLLASGARGMSLPDDGSGLDIEPPPIASIVGGAPLEAYARPFLLQLSAGDGEFLPVFCGAALVHESWALTAAHCVYSRRNEPGRFRVTAAEHDVKVTEGYEQRRTVTKIVIHKKYNRSTIDRDIALLKLDAPMNLTSSRVGLVAYGGQPKDCPAPGQQCSVMGWGTLKSGGSVPRVPYEVSVSSVPNWRCRQMYPRAITYYMNCFGEAEGGKDSCQGDSGGPLVCECGGTLYHSGIVSWGYGCADARYPGVYTRTAVLSTWIDKCIRTDGSCWRL